jgi:signal transduction histidine kinase
MRSLSKHLLQRVLSVYLLVTLAIFGLQVWLDFRRAESGLVHQLEMLQKTYADSVGYALWQMDKHQLDVTLKGMLELGNVSRISTGLDNGEIIRSAAIERMPMAPWFVPEAHYVSRWPVKVVHDGRSVPLGWLQIESSSHLVLKQLSESVLFIFAAALLKTTVLVLLFKLFFDRHLSRPVLQLAEAARRLKPQDAQAKLLPVKREAERDELDIIALAINGLMADVQHTLRVLDQFKQELELKVQRRSQALLQTNQALRQERQELREALLEIESRELLLQQANRDLADSLTRLQSTQQQLLEARKMASLGGLVAGVAHELNTPIGMALTGSSFLVDQIKAMMALQQEHPELSAALEHLTKPAAQMADLVLSSLERAAGLIRSFKRVAPQADPLQMQAFSMRDCIQEVLLRREASLRGVEVQLLCDARLQPYSDPGACGQLLELLLNNCLLHGFNAGPENCWPPAQIRIEFLRQASCWQLEVLDNGQGMSPDILERAYEPFFTTKRQHGFGLGLHIAYNLVVQQLGGSIQLQSEIGRGCLVRIQLPIGPASNALASS